MIIKTLFIVLVILIGTGRGQSQDCGNKLNPVVQISFSPDGKIIEFPHPILTLQNYIHFSVKAPLDFIASQQKALLDQLKKTSEILTLRKNKYSCFFNGKEIEDYLAQLKKIIELMEGKDFCLENIDSNKGVLSPGSVPAYEYLQKVLNNQFEIKIYNGSNCIKTIQLKANSFSCNSCCVEFDSTCGKLGNMICKACTPQGIDQLNFQLVRHDPLANTLLDWYNIQSNALNTNTKIDPENIIKQLQKAAEVKICIDKDNNKQALTDLRQLKDWFINWFWLTRGNITLDPVQHLLKSQQADLKKRINNLSYQIAELNEKQKFNDSVKAKLRPFPFFTNVFWALSELGTRLTKQINDLSKTKSQLQDQIDNGIQYPQTLLQTSTVLNLVKAAISDKPFIDIFGKGFTNLQKQFDASRSYKPLHKNYREQRRLTEVPEDEKVKILIHNLDTSLTVKLDEKVLDFDDTEEFTKLVSEQLGKLDFSSISSDVFSNVYNFFGSLSTRQEPVLKGADTVKSKCDCPDFQPFLKSLWDDHQNGIVAFPPEQVLPQTVNLKTTPLLRTEMFSIKDVDAPFKDSILFRQAIKKDTTEVGKTIVKVGKLRFLQLAAGFAFTRKPATLTTIDTTGGAFKVTTKDNEFAAIAGFKIYPFNNYNRDGNIIPRYPLRRLSLFGGFEIIHPLKNFYVGGTYDVVPGLAFNYGANWYQTTNYQIQNGQIVNTSRTFKKSGSYYSVMVNPTLFIQVVKYFFKQI